MGLEETISYNYRQRSQNPPKPTAANTHPNTPLHTSLPPIPFADPIPFYIFILFLHIETLNQILRSALYKLFALALLRTRRGWTKEVVWVQIVFFFLRSNWNIFFHVVSSWTFLVSSSGFLNFWCLINIVRLILIHIVECWSLLGVFLRGFIWVLRFWHNNSH